MPTRRSSETSAGPRPGRATSGRTALLGGRPQARAAGLVAIAVVTAIAILDVVTGQGPVLIGVLILGPLIAGLGASPRGTALASAYAVALAVVLGGPNHILGSSDHMVRLLVVAAAGALAVLAAELRRRREGALALLAAQHAVTATLARPGEPDAAALLEGIGANLGWAVGDLWRPDPTAESLRSVETWCAPEIPAADFQAATREHALHRGEGLPGRVWATGQSIWTRDLSAGSGFRRAPAAAGAGLRAAFAFPIVGASGVIGVIEFLTPEAREPEASVLDTMAGLGRQIGEGLERARAEAAVRESEARKAAVFEAALDCVITMDHEGRVVDFNPAAERTFGHAREEAIGARLGDLIVPPSLREAHERGLARYLATGKGAILDRRVELTGMRADGSELPVEVTITRIRSEGPPTFTGYLRDITARREAEEERAGLLEGERTARLRAERAERRSAVLAEAGTLVGTSLDLEATLENVARLVVPRLADWCIVDLLRDDGEIERLAVAHADPAKLQLARELERRGPARLDTPAASPQVIRTGRPELHAEVSDALLEGVARDEDHLALLRALGFGSIIVVPLRARGRILGALTLAAAESGRRYDDDDLSLAETLAGRCALALDNARLYRERSSIARTLQDSLLPPHLPEIAGLELAARYRPAGEGIDVGGDFYDVFQTAPDRWALVIGDVRGKGTAAAALTGLVRYTTHAAAIAQGDPVDVLRLVNDAVLRRRDPDERFCTAAYAAFASGGPGLRLRLACAGHPLPLLLRRGGEVEVVGRPGTLLGVMAEIEVAAQEVELAAGDALVLYTDGVLEARAGEELFGADRLAALLRSCAGASAAGIAERVEREVLAFQSDRPRDDVALLVLRVPPVPAERPGGDGRARPRPLTTS